MIGLGILIFFALMAVVGPPAVHYDATENPLQIYQPPSLAHLLGTDYAGRDVGGEVVVGSTPVLLVAVLVAVISVAISIVVGMMAGFSGSAVDAALRRVADVFLTIPSFPLLVVLTGFLRVKEPLPMAGVLSIAAWAGLARAIRAQVLTLAQRDFVEAARIAGLSRTHIILRELLPNMAPYIAMNFVLAFTGAIYAEVGLFLLGVAPFTATNWGVMLRGEELRRFRWKEMAMVFQSALNTLNPVMRIRDQVVDTVRAHERVSEQEAIQRAVQGLRWVRLDPTRVLRSYPHELSGGMKQRVGIMMALLLQPKILILDEPTTALDVLSQRAILQILKRIQRELGLTMLFITHDLALIAEVADRVGVMYAGRLVEVGSLRDIFMRTHHPYTRALIKAVPVPNPAIADLSRPLPVLDAEAPSTPGMIPGCTFHPRCPYADELSRRQVPVLEEIAPGHRVACFHARELMVGRLMPSTPMETSDAAAP